MLQYISYTQKQFTKLLLDYTECESSRRSISKGKMYKKTSKNLDTKRKSKEKNFSTSEIKIDFSN